MKMLFVAAPALILSGTAIAQQTGTSETVSGAMIGQQSLPTPQSVAAAAVPTIVAPAPTIKQPAVLSDDGAHSATPQGPDPDNLSTAERITVKSPGIAEISGEYRINSSFMISVPVIGRINVRDMNVAVLERELSERASKISGRDAYVTVEITEYRPIFMTGLINKPGATPWQPGMTVIQALATSGGIFRPQVEASASVMGVDVESTRIRRGVAEQKRALASLARLQAEQADADHIEIPERLVKLVGKTEAEQLIAAQQSLFQSRKTAHETVLAALEREDALAKAEIDGLSKQVVRVADQLTLRSKILEDVESLRAKGLTRAERSLEEKSKIAELQDRESIVSVSLARMNSVIAAKNREITQLKQARRAEIDTEMSKLEREIALLDIDIEAAQYAYRRMTGRSIASDAEGGNPQEVFYEIIRPENGVQKVMQVNQFSAIWPGDIVVVK